MKMEMNKQASRRDNMKIYGYDIERESNSNCFIFTAEEDRDLHFNQNIQASEQEK